MEPKAFDDLLARAARRTWRAPTGVGPVISIHLEEAPPEAERPDTLAAFQKLERTACELGVDLALTGGGYGCVSFEMTAKTGSEADVARLVETPAFLSDLDRTGATELHVRRVERPIGLGKHYAREVAYLTNRAPRPDGDFGNTWTPELRAGFVEVLVPAGGRPSREPGRWLSLVSPFTGRSKREPILQGRREVTPEQMAEEFAVGQRAGLLHVHGVATTFRDALVDTAELSRNLQIEKLGLWPVVFCWPSQGPPPNYSVDINLAERSEAVLAKALDLLGRKLPTLHAVAHSHGSKLLLGAMQELKASYGVAGNAFETVLLVAPDVDPDVMEGLLPHMMAYFKRGALYYCDRDLALALSGVVISHAKRAGAVGLRNGHPKLDCIDVSSMAKGLVAHSYHTDAPLIMSDMFYALRGEGAASRYGPTASGTPGFYMFNAVPKAA